MRTNEWGFIALMSVIIISAILLVLVFTLGTASFFDRFDALNAENKRVSLGLAEACVNAAMLKIAQNPTYAPAASGDCVTLGGTCAAADPQKVCKICSVVTVGNESTISTRAVYNSAYTNLHVTIDTIPGNITILSWTELPSGELLCVVP